MNRRPSVLAGALALALIVGSRADSTPSPSGARALLDAMPLAFVENRGQVDASVAYYVQSIDYGVYFSRHGHALRIARGRGTDARAHTIRVDLVEAAARRIEGRQPARGVASYFKGPREDWRTAIPTQARIGYVQPWAGIDLDYDGENGRLESFYTVAPHADATRIRLRYSGQDSLTTDAAGNLVYDTTVGRIVESAPLAWQVIDGRRRAVACRFALLARDTVGFVLGAYDAAHALFIDPEMAYAGFVGGSSEDYGNAIAVDADGNAYIAGETQSTEQSFPETVGPDLSYNGTRRDAYVAKVSADGTGLVYAGYIGGGADDFANAIAVDGDGNAYVTGFTVSTDFPASVGPDLTHNGGNANNFEGDAFVAKVNAAGIALSYSGFIGGGADEQGLGIAVDDAGNAYVTGWTTSSEASFPVAGGPDLSHNGGRDAFVAKVGASGTALSYAGYIGGTGEETAYGVALDGYRNAYVTGYTTSTEASFPVGGGPDLTHNGNADAFIAKVAANGATLAYAGYVGGSGDDIARGVAVDGDGNAYLAGETDSTESSFPVAGGPDLAHNGGGSDAFVAKLGPSGGALVYAGYIGGNRGDYASDIAVDDAGNAYVAGGTDSTEATFPVTDGPDLTYNGGLTQLPDAFVAKLNAGGDALIYASYLGGSERDYASGIALDRAANAYVVGTTESGPFPATVGPDTTWNFNRDAFVAKFGTAPLPPEGANGDGSGGGGSPGLPALLALALVALARRR